MARPQGVRIVRGDTGEQIPCELIHRGMVDGTDTWEITGMTYRIGIDSVRMDVLPAHTTVAVGTDAVIEDPDG